MSHKVESAFSYRLMAFSYRLRDFLRPRMDILKEVGIKPGDHVLDYGCGPGGYITPVAKLAGKKGKIYAVDIHPLAVRMVQNIAVKKQITGLETYCSDCKTGIRNNSIDVALLYDVLHDIKNPGEVLAELHRVLKPNGILSVRDHHMKEEEILSGIENKGLFHLVKRGERTYNFSKSTSTV